MDKRFFLELLIIIVICGEPSFSFVQSYLYLKGDTMKKLLALFMVSILTISAIACTKQPATKKTSEQQQEVKKEQKEDKKQDKKQEDKVTDDNTADKKQEDKSVNLYPDFIINETDDSVTYVDAKGQETTVKKNPKKVVIGYNSILGLWYFAGGKSLTKAKGTTNVPKEALENIDLGSTSSLSVEAIVALEPDLVILPANYNTQANLAPTLKEMGISTMLVDVTSHAFERFKQNSYLFSKINGTEDKYESKVKPILESINDTIKKANDVENKPKVASIFVASKYMKLESSLGVTGEIMDNLGGVNVLNDSDLLVENETRVEFNIEHLIAQNPDIITISTMGNIEAAKKNMNKMIGENPAWKDIAAVKNDRVFYLPKDISVYKPNERYDEAFTYIAKLLYPEIFGEK